MGAARAQLHENYILSQTENGLVIVDAHAAHERLVYEKLKAQMAETGVRAQALLIPEVISLSNGDIALLMEQNETLTQMGLSIEPFGQGAVAVQSVPDLLAMWMYSAWFWISSMSCQTAERSKACKRSWIPY